MLHRISREIREALGCLKGGKVPEPGASLQQKFIEIGR